MSLDQLTTFMGWNALIQIVLLSVVALFLIFARNWIARIHSAMMGVEVSALPVLYFQYVAVYKLLVIVFVLVPYLVLRLGV